MNWKVLFALILSYIVYLLIGGAIFQAIERPTEEQQCEDTKAAVGQLVNFVRNQSQSTNGTIQIQQIANLSTIIRNAASFGIQVNENFEVLCSVNWDFQSAFFFSGTVVTTIGYGHISPNTPLGRSICILYAIIGIPLFGMMFAGMGENISEQIKKVDQKVRGKAKRSWVAKAVVILAVLIVFLVLCLIIPAVIFMSVEGWDYRDSFYYAFITITTIGFGDFVAGANPEINYIPIYRVMVYFWILFGMAFMATVVSLISDFFKKTGEKAKNRMTGVSEEDGVENDEEDGGQEKGTGYENCQQQITEKATDNNEATRNKNFTDSSNSNESLENKPFNTDQDANGDARKSSIAPGE